MRPAIETVSVYCSPETVEPSPNCKLKDWPTSLEVELFLGLYAVWPEQVEPQLGPGRNRSEEPVSKSTESSLDNISLEL